MARILGVCPATTALATIDPTEDGLLDPDTLMMFSSTVDSDIGDLPVLRAFTLPDYYMVPL